MKEIVLVMEVRYMHTLGYIRGIPGLKAAIDDERIWLRGIMPGDKTQPQISSLPVLTSYELDTGDRLFPAGGLTPTGILKTLEWQPIDTFIPVELPVSALPGNATAKMPLMLSRSDKTHEAFALMAELDDWKAFADTAPFTRLKQLSFAVSSLGKTLITGLPLPIIKGQTYWRNGQMLLPAGYDFEMPVIASLLAATLAKDSEVLVLFDRDGNYQHISLTNFAPAKRSAVRLTQIG